MLLLQLLVCRCLAALRPASCRGKSINLLGLSQHIFLLTLLCCCCRVAVLLLLLPGIIVALHQATNMKHEHHQRHFNARLVQSYKPNFGRVSPAPPLPPSLSSPLFHCNAIRSVSLTDCLPARVSLSALLPAHKDNVASKKKHIKCLSTRSPGGNHCRYILSSRRSGNKYNNNSSTATTIPLARRLMLQQCCCGLNNSYNVCAC